MNNNNLKSLKLSGSGMFCTNQHLTPTRHCSFWWAKTKRDSLKVRWGRLVSSSLVQGQDMNRIVVEFHSGLGTTVNSNLETSLKKKASTIGRFEIPMWDLVPSSAEVGECNHVRRAQNKSQANHLRHTGGGRKSLFLSQNTGKLETKAIKSQ